jgi:hypothetical protein
MRGALQARREHAPTPSEAAWIAVVPGALLVVAAIVVLGPVLGHTFPPPRRGLMFAEVTVRPEPVEHGRYIVALLGPLLLAAAIPLLNGRTPMLPAGTVRRLVAIGRFAAFAFVLAALLAQYGVLPGAVREPFSPLTRYFKPLSIAAAALFVLVLVLALRSRVVVQRVAGWALDSRRRRIVWIGVAVAFSADWLLRSINLDSTIGNGPILNLVPWEMDEAFAVLNGGTPLVDFHEMYSQLWSVVVAAIMVPAGASAGAWTTAMATISGLGLLAVYGVFRRTVRSSLLALALYAPFTAISLWVVGPPSSGTSYSSVFSVWPMRYAAPYMLAWLTARHIDGAAPRRAAIVFLVGGLVTIDNLEFGLGALAGTVAALVLAAPTRSRRAWAQLGAGLAIGLVASAALVSAPALARTGELPHPGFLLEFPRLFGVAGWILEPMPTFGLHIAMYTTFVAAIVVAVVRATRGAGERVLTGMLAWAGVFGLIAGSYYVGRSDPGNLPALFSAWSLTLALLLVVVARELIARPRRPTLPELAVMFGFGLALASLPNTPSPAAQVARLGATTAQPLFKQPQAMRFVAARTVHGERVLILAPLGHRIAHDLGLVNVSPYTSVEAMPARAQVQTAIDVARRLHVRYAFVKSQGTGDEQDNDAAILRAFREAGFSVDGEESALVAFVDAAGAK